ncbi:MAG: hypothetical protein WD270_13560 [Acetobacterales bacterium]
MDTTIQEATADAYGTSHIKRLRATKSEVQDRRDAIYAIVKVQQPMSVRQVFYQASVHGIVEKAESGYRKVQTDLTLMRRDGTLPYGWLADSTRWRSKPDSFNSAKQAVVETARYYRKALWSDLDTYVEIWLEKDALAGVVYPVTALYDVPLMVARGYASLSFLHSAAEEIRSLRRRTYIYHLGDYDPSGVNAAEKIEETLKEMAPDDDITFERIAVTPEQIEAWDLPTRPTKKSDTRSKGFGDVSVELDAIPPDRLRELVTSVLELHLPADQLETLQAAEASERQMLRGIAEMVGGR